MTIDGYTQPGAKENTGQVGTDARLLVELSRGNSGTIGLRIDADDVVVRGLVINCYPESHIEITGGTGIGIEGSFLGTDPSGTLDLEGDDDGGGVNVNEGVGNVMGGTSLAARNLISGNDRAGIVLFGSSLDDRVKNNRIEGNLIGTKRNGTSPLGKSAGIGIFRSSGNTVGGTAPGATNTIAFSGSEGVSVFEEESTSNRILGNSIHSNERLGIDLAGGTEKAAGATGNDPGDADIGPDNLQSKAAVTSATNTGGTIAVRGNLNSTPEKTFLLQFFSNPGGNDGKTFVAQRSVTTNANGNAPFAFSFAKVIPAGHRVSATATGAGNTSEFSAPRVVVTR